MDIIMDEANWIDEDDDYADWLSLVSAKVVNPREVKLRTQRLSVYDKNKEDD